MNRRELVRLGWRESSLAYLEKHLQGLKDPQAYQEQYQSVFFFASPLFQNMWFQEIKDLTETAAQDLLRGVMKILLMPSDLSGTCEETAFLLSRMSPDCPPGSDFWKGFFTRRCKSPLKGSLSRSVGRSALETPGSPVTLPTFKLPSPMDSDA